jgi:hypothetical protein
VRLATTQKWAGQYGLMVAEVEMKHFGKFPLKDLDFVQEEDGRRTEEPPQVDNTLEEDE